MALQEEFEQQGIWLFRYRGILPLIILFIGFVIYLYSLIYTETFFLIDATYKMYYEMGCLLISLLGLAIRIYTIGHAPKNTSGRNVNKQIADTLNTTGSYSLVRHPLYVGNFFMWLGPALLTGTYWFVIAFCFLYVIYYERIMFAEEKYLRNKFGDIFLNWSNNVPAFIPDFNRFVKPGLSFNWKKVLKKEKNGLAAIFIVFFVFDFSGELLENETDYNYFILVSCILTVLCYLVLTYLKKHTRLLDENIDNSSLRQGE